MKDYGRFMDSSRPIEHAYEEGEYIRGQLAFYACYAFDERESEHWKRGWLDAKRDREERRARAIAQRNGERGDVNA